MSTLITFTSYDEIRAVLGVSNEEIEDVSLALPMYHDQLIFRLEDVSATLPSTYETILAKAAVDRTVAEAKLYSLTRLYSAYGVASDLIVSLPMFSAKRTTDGKAEVERFDPMSDMKAGVEGMLAPLLRRLQAALAVVDVTYSVPSAPTTIHILGTGIARDPVTSST